MSRPFPSIPEAQMRQPAFRRQMIQKIESVMAVMEIMRIRVRMSQGQPGANSLRLQRTRSDAERILQVCLRARWQLQNWSPSQPMESGMSYREYLEVLSYEEYVRMNKQGPIQQDELESVDLDALCAKLLRSDSAA
ncbi:MAG: hypothetical protein OTJ44_03115 [Planctomycetota bacterium]|jgi:hypothetical protein|nr:hypothetical protein [Planctomycetota bacterium]